MDNKAKCFNGGCYQRYLTEMETIEIVACTDHQFIMPTGVMMCSVCKNNHDQALRFHVIIDESVTEEDKADLKIVAEEMPVMFYIVDGQAFHSMPLIAGLSHATYYRLLIPQILPKDVHKALYLDSDTIVRHSLRSIWETDILGYAIAAVTDGDESFIEKYNRQRYSPSLGYFNAGVLLINLHYWRTNNIHNEIESYIVNHFESIRCCDQDILNYVLREKKKTLPIKYNTQSQFLFVLEKIGYDYWKYEKEVAEARKDPVIIHYTLAIGKPWIEGCIHPYKSSFLKYQNETKWKGHLWSKPRRPFLTKVFFHTKNVVWRALQYVRLQKDTFTQKDNIFFLEMSPID